MTFLKIELSLFLVPPSSCAEMDLSFLDDDGNGAQGGSGTLNQDVARLREAWVQESVCPELLPFEGELVRKVTEMVDNQEELIEGIDKDADVKFIISLYLMDVERSANSTPNP